MPAISTNWPPVLPSLELLDVPTRNRVTSLHTSLLPHHQHIATYATSLHPTKNPCRVIGDKYTWGQTFLVYEVLFGNGVPGGRSDGSDECESWVIRFAMGMDEEHEERDTSPEQLERKILNEVATLHLVRERTTIPVPEVLGYCAVSGTGTRGINPLGEEFPPFVLMTSMKGKTIEDLGVNLYDLGRHWCEGEEDVGDEDFDEVDTDDEFDYLEFNDEAPQDGELEHEFEKLQLGGSPSPSNSYSSPSTSPVRPKRRKSRARLQTQSLSRKHHRILQNYLQSLSSIHLQLSLITFDKIGSFVFSSPSPVHDKGKVTVGPSADFGLGPFDTAEEYFAMQKEAYVRLAWAYGDDLASGPSTPLSPSTPHLSSTPSRPVMKRLFAASLYAETMDLLHGAHLDQPGLTNNHGPFPVTHGDMHSENILVDDEGFIVGVLDWDCAGTVPWEKAAVIGFEIGGGYTLNLGQGSEVERNGSKGKSRGGMIHRMYNRALSEAERKVRLRDVERRFELSSKGSLTSLISESASSEFSSEVSSSPSTSSTSLSLSSPATSPSTSPCSSTQDLTLTPTCSSYQKPAFLTNRLAFTLSSVLPSAMPFPSLLQAIHSPTRSSQSKHLPLVHALHSATRTTTHTFASQARFGKFDPVTTGMVLPRRSLASLHDSLTGYVTSYLGHWMYALGCDFERTGKALFDILRLLRRDRGDWEEETMDEAFEKFVKAEHGGEGRESVGKGAGGAGLSVLDELD